MVKPSWLFVISCPQGFDFMIFKTLTGFGFVLLIDSLFNLRDGGGSSGGYKRSNSQHSLKAETTVTPSRLVVDRERKKQVLDDSTTVLPSQLERQNCH